LRIRAVPGKLRLTRELVMAHLTRCRAGALRGVGDRPDDMIGLKVARSVSVPS
jgi:hypothetical protein